MKKNSKINLNTKEFIGKKIVALEGFVEDSEEMTIRFKNGSTIRLYHCQDCCEDVRVAQVDGLVQRHVGAKFQNLVEKVYHNDDIPGFTDSYDSITATFYTLETSKGRLDFRWTGESNGYYSEDVDMEINNTKKD